RKHKLCKENPTANWKYEDGSVATCESINSNHEVRVLPASPELRSQLRSNADQARDLMEGIRQDVVRFQSQDAGAAWLPSTLRQLQTSWSDLRDMFCGYYKNAEYI